MCVLIKLSLLPEYFWTQIINSMTMVYFCPLVPDNVLVRFLLLWWNTDQNNSRRKELILAYGLLFHYEGAGTQRPWRNAAHWFAPHTLLWLLSYAIQDQDMAWNGTAHSGMGPPFGIIKQENALQIWQQVCLVEAFSQLQFPLSRLLQPVSSWWKS